MNAYKEMVKGIKWVLDNCTSYQVAKDLNINNRTVNRYQNGTSTIENMSLGTAEKIYNYYKEMVNMTHDYKNALTIEMKFDDLNDILEKYAATKQRNIDMHVRKEANEFKEKLIEHIGYEVEEIIEDESDEREIYLNDYLSVEFEIVEQVGNIYTVDIKVGYFDQSAVFGDLY